MPLVLLWLVSYLPIQICVDITLLTLPLVARIAQDVLNLEVLARINRDGGKVHLSTKYLPCFCWGQQRLCSCHRL